MKLRKGSFGTHFFDRRSGLNLLDEAPVPFDQWSTAPKYLSFALTNTCELSCEYCYASKVPARLSAESICLWANELDGAGCFGVGFGGGEPTLFPRFADLCQDVHSGTNLAVTFTTHGHQFSSRLVSELQGHVDFIRLSMDGIGSTYERLRGRSFLQFTKKLDLVKDTSKFGINFVVNESTLAELPRAVEFSFQQGAKEFLILPQLSVEGRSVLTDTSVESLAIWVNQNWRHYPLTTSSTGATIMNIPTLPVSDSANESYDFMHIDALGKLKRSAFESIGIQLFQGTSILDAIDSLRGDHQIGVSR